MRLKRIRDALAAMEDDELRALRDAAADTGRPCPALFLWLEHVAAWELDRRDGQNYVLRLPSEGMEQDDIPAALEALGKIAALFRKTGSGPVDELLAAAAELIRGGDALH